MSTYFAWLEENLLARQMEQALLKSSRTFRQGDAVFIVKREGDSQDKFVDLVGEVGIIRYAIPWKNSAVVAFHQNDDEGPITIPHERLRHSE